MHINAINAYATLQIIFMKTHTPNANNLAKGKCWLKYWRKHKGCHLDAEGPVIEADRHFVFHSV